MVLLITKVSIFFFQELIESCYLRLVRMRTEVIGREGLLCDSRPFSRLGHAWVIILSMLGR